jgi:ankyrin repeat protein
MKQVVIIFVVLSVQYCSAMHRFQLICDLTQIAKEIMYHAVEAIDPIERTQTAAVIKDMAVTFRAGKATEALVKLIDVYWYEGSDDIEINSIEKLLKDGAQVHARGKEGETFLHLAARDSRDDLIRLFIAYGADVNIGNSNGYPPINYGFIKRNFKTLQLFIALGASVYKKNSSLLADAVFNQDTEMVNFFLSLGVDPDVRNICKDNPLHYAVMRDDEKLIKILLDWGADPDKKNNSGESALDYAKHHNKTRIFKILTERKPVKIP